MYLTVADMLLGFDWLVVVVRDQIVSPAPFLSGLTRLGDQAGGNDFHWSVSALLSGI